MRVVGRVLIVAVALVVVAAVLGFGYRAWRQHENAQALAITAPNGIEEASFVKIGGLEQWIQIRGENRDNPVLLFIHGGPGGSVAAVSSVLRNWEEHFTVVMWDQRGAGKTFSRNGAPSEQEMTIDRVADDGIEVAEYLRQRLHQQKIIALGHSWGTMVGVVMMHKRPDLFSAYVGTGQVVSIAEKEPILYAATMKKVRDAHDEEGVKELTAIGAPPYRSAHDLEVERKWSERYDIPAERDLFSNLTPVALYAPGYSLLDLYDMTQSIETTGAANFREHWHYDARKYGLTFAMPAFIFNGEFDAITPADLAKAYFDKIQAPAKQFVLLKNAGHSAVLTEPDVFLHELETRVRPIVESETKAITGTPHG
jgi:pimeloyl-ACP methyl ester carboxylesterase